MKYVLLLVACVIFAASLSSCGRRTSEVSTLKDGAELNFEFQTSTIILASQSSASRLLSAPDEFYSQFDLDDLDVRTKSAGITDIEDKSGFFKFCSQQALNFSDAEADLIRWSLVRIENELSAAQIRLLLPETIVVSKTTGLEEFDNPYTRGNFIVIPQSGLEDTTPERLGRTLAHELFHIMSRFIDAKDSQKKDELYRVIGFEKIADSDIDRSALLPATFITNPDAPTLRYALQIQNDAKNVWGTTFFYLDRNWSAEDPFSSLRTVFCELSNTHGQMKVAVGAQGAPLCSSLDDDSSEPQEFWDQVGKNTSYNIHPEEILAENFSFLLRTLDTSSQSAPGLASGDNRSTNTSRYPSQSIMVKLRNHLRSIKD